ncbi:MAG: orotate phosphoribosyltransferase-like protein [Archaeoglobaceae archaeon]|nr:orotate phosphoribosyltransferase-like protein [Archaeoglobaceae archaeon]
MKIDSLVEKAKKLREKGLMTEEIADELNVSFETAMWLLTKATETPPSDIYIEWRNLSKPSRLRLLAIALADMISEKYNNIDAVVGIATSGIPLASMVAEELSTDFAVYYPRKVRGEEVKGGVLSENFSKVGGKNCAIVDDVISTGRTISEAIEVISANNGKVVCVAVMVDKGGKVDVPVLCLLRITRI